ncbi:MAG: deoxyribonuclease V [Planctomycetes bacterium]|nr:deoxyribonuclease V [Planctomycetota bacterium]
MGVNLPTRWDPTPQAARELQERLRARVECLRRTPQIATVAGVDCGIRDGHVRAAIAVYRYPELELVEAVTRERELRFPYIPGLLAFRELPAIEAAWAALREPPDVLLVDGHGIAHPRRFGIASHLGVVVDRPSIGCGKSLLVGEHAPLGDERGAREPLVDHGERIGLALRTRARVRPVYVSIGHRVDLEFAAEVVLACSIRYRLPEPVRHADALASDRLTRRTARPSR